MAQTFPAYVHLERAGVSVLCSLKNGIPQVLWWGSRLVGAPAMNTDEFTAWADSVVLAQSPALGSGVLDIFPKPSFLPEESTGWPEQPGLQVSRDNLPLATKFILQEAEASTPEDPKLCHRLTSYCVDEPNQLGLRLEVTLHPGGLLEVVPEVINLGTAEIEIRQLAVHLPVPASETKILSQTGHHLRERDMQLHDFTIGVHLRTIHHARSHTVSSIYGTVEPETGWQKGSAHLIHMGWSGNQQLRAIANPQGLRYLAGGEWLEAGEGLVLAGQSFTAASLFASYGYGLDQASGRFHDFLRSLSAAPKRPRPVTLNAWEAVYFDHSYERLSELVEAAAKIGVERFVLDDGWFGSRRNDRKGLGDWYVSDEVWPEGLKPLADLIHGRGMEFGLWFEPEMINPDSDLAREHPDWILSAPSHLPIEARYQQVLNLTRPEAFDYILERLIDVIGSNQVDYIKWDYNRDLFEALDRSTGQACYREQTLATYRILAALRERFPKLEIESCAGGGGRIDLGIMRYCQRVWGSDCIDPLERQQIEAGTALLLPPELVGSHVASDVSHTTGRAHTLAFRCATAIFSHMGVEWDLSKVSADKLAQLEQWISRYKELRGLLHTGQVVHLDHPDPSVYGHGVVSIDQNRAVFAFTKLTSSVDHPSCAIRLAGIHPDRKYRIYLDPLTPDPGTHDFAQLPWAKKELVLDGATLLQIGLAFPLLNPENTLLVHLEATE